MGIEVITNRVPRQILEWWEVPEEIRLKEFDYHDAESIESAGFFKYKGEYYDLGEMMVPPEPLIQYWHYYTHWTFSSGIVVKYIGKDKVLVGRYYAS